MGSRARKADRRRVKGGWLWDGVLVEGGISWNGIHPSSYPRQTLETGARMTMESDSGARGE
jgi:hypothetical protein